MYLFLKGNRTGPHEPEEVKALFDSGKVSRDDLAWKDGMLKWKPLKELFPEWETESEKPPMPQEQPPQDESAKPAPKPANPPPDKLYLVLAGEKRGPLSSDETFALFQSSEVKENDLAWKSGMDEWKPLKEVWPDCSKVKPAAKPVQQAHSANLSETPYAKNDRIHPVSVPRSSSLRFLRDKTFRWHRKGLPLALLSIKD